MTLFAGVCSPPAPALVKGLSLLRYIPANDSPSANCVHDPAAVDDFFSAGSVVRKQLLDYDRRRTTRASTCRWHRAAADPGASITADRRLPGPGNRLPPAEWGYLTSAVMYHDLRYR